MEPKVLIIDGGLGPTGRSLWLRDRLIGLGIDVEYRMLESKIQGKTPTLLIQDDFSELEDRILNACVIGYSHPEMFRQPDLPADKRKGPKGPRTKWGKLK